MVENDNDLNKKIVRQITTEVGRIKNIIIAKVSQFEKRKIKLQKRSKNKKEERYKFAKMNKNEKKIKNFEKWNILKSYMMIEEQS